ncbi:MAG: pteridine reductase [Wenzhouxiangella sp.]|nr:pteridine reductase [Wenzhouxiangella sp.]
MSQSALSHAPCAIITGGARRIGAQIARHLHRRGLSICLHYRGSESEARVTADELNAERSGSAALVCADLADPDAGQTIHDAALSAFGRIDVLINNASAFYPTPVKRATQEHWDDLFASNARGPFFLSRMCAPELARRPGSIVNIVDIHGLVPLKDNTIYSMAKAALVMQTKALAKDLAPMVRVNGVAPGSILWPEGDAEAGEEAQKAILEKVPLQRQGRPEDIAGAVEFLALDAPYVTGQILAVDGGRLLNM